MTNLAAIKNDDQGTTMVKPARVKPARAFLPEGLREGAMVLTLDGPIPVEHLQDGDRIITRDAGPVELRNIRSRMLQSVRPVMVAVGALGHGNPDEEIIMAPGQRVMLRGAEAMDRFGRDEVIVKVVDLCDGETMQQAAQPMKLRIFLLEFDAEHIIYADGVEVACTPSVEGTNRPGLNLTPVALRQEPLQRAGVVPDEPAPVCARRIIPKSRDVPAEMTKCA